MFTPVSKFIKLSKFLFKTLQITIKYTETTIKCCSVNKIFRQFFFVVNKEYDFLLLETELGG